ncbi:MAG: hypothetical protein KF861_20875, partial [Planctomycetaceae bacterium]|nr:hypothetical protein [Planctomycetaceae bacterium]
VLETMVFACCLEDASHGEAESGYRNLLASFHDWNEIRVSSISEVERSLGNLEDAAWRAFRTRDILQYVFEEYYVFDFESLRRKNLEGAEKQLSKIKGLTPFVQQYTMQHALGAHVVPMDDTLCRVLAWMGLIEPETPPDQAAEELKSSVRKSDVPLLCHLLRQLGTDAHLKSSFKITKAMLTDGVVDTGDMAERLDELLDRAGNRVKATSKKRKKPVERNASRAAQRGNAKASASKKSVTKKVTRPKPSGKKAATRGGAKRS